MTDQTCETCANPLMRTPNLEPVKTICVACGERGEASSSSCPLSVSLKSKRSSSSRDSDTQSIADISTPATDLSRELTMPELPMPIIDTEESLRRRAQSDQASAVIGQRLLQGWTMLADECSRPTCYGVPLVRPPRSRDGLISDSRVCNSKLLT